VEGLIEARGFTENASPLTTKRKIRATVRRIEEDMVMFYILLADDVL
jgi:hypothetical protein